LKALQSKPITHRRKRNLDYKTFFDWFTGTLKGNRRIFFWKILTYKFLYLDNNDPVNDEIAELIKDDLWPNPLQYYLVPDIEGIESRLTTETSNIHNIFYFFFKLKLNPKVRKNMTVKRVMSLARKKIWTKKKVIWKKKNQSKSSRFLEKKANILIIYTHTHSTHKATHNFSIWCGQCDLDFFFSVFSIKFLSFFFIFFVLLCVIFLDHTSVGLFKMK
jgi:hypothetical protein